MPKDTKQSAGREPRAGPPAGFLRDLVPVAILEAILPMRVGSRITRFG
jgi:hypothetical protein